ncbi:hypothetical protein CCY99_08945 [Helicobacter sp. 16-1353]|uniref:DUF6056 family protein n=1 Tax=Helicobacter sp. 16-1353 TaxID=2004996 RepID=UPI000DCBB5D9|nr:DUF6056 family protein [Helicobacter sp. 16-1353]RAX51489.1 hypothetical protein CCY99_08945 [Helicobacter sp. 16-1353]
MLKNYKTLSIFSFIFIYLFILNYFTPIQGDDWNYLLSPKDAIDTGIKVFLTWNSRLGEFLHSSYLIRLPFFIFDLFNAFVGSIFIFLFFYFCFLRLPKNMADFGLIATLLVSFMLLLSFEEVFLWGSGSANYLWTFVVVGIFLLPYRIFFNDLKSFKKMPKFLDSIYFYILFFIFSIMAGMWHEVVSAVVLACLVILVLYIKIFMKISQEIPQNLDSAKFRDSAKNVDSTKLAESTIKPKLPFWIYIGILGFFIGFCILYFSPGQNARIAEESQMRDFISLKDFLLLDFSSKVSRIYIVLDSAAKSNPIFFPVFGFIVAFIYIFKDVLKKILLFIAIAIATILYIFILLEMPLLAYLLVWGMFIYIYFKTKDRLFLVAFLLFGVWFLSTLSTFQLLDLPFRARAFGILFLIAIIVLFVARLLQYRQNLAYIFIVLGILYFAYVGVCYYSLSKQWENLVSKVDSEIDEFMRNGGKPEMIHLRLMDTYDVEMMGYGIDVVIPKSEYNPTNRMFSSWWRLTSDPKANINQSYSRIFRIKSIRVE